MAGILPNTRAYCPVCQGRMDWPPGEVGPVLCLRCGQRVQLPAEATDAETGVTELVLADVIDAGGGATNAPERSDDTVMAAVVAPGEAKDAAAVDQPGKVSGPEVRDGDPAPPAPAMSTGRRVAVVACCLTAVVAVAVMLTLARDPLGLGGALPSAASDVAG